MADLRDTDVLGVRELPPLSLAGGERAHVAGASGIVRVGAWLHVVSDDVNHVYSWRIPASGSGTATPFTDGELPRDPTARKAAKTDVEALLVLRDGDAQLLVGLGSGSTDRRRACFACSIDDDGRITGPATTFDAGPMYDLLATDAAPPNVEGAAQLGEEVVLLLRSSTGDNRVARLDAGRVLAGIDAGVIDGDALLGITPCSLGRLGGISLGFTDATAIDGTIWFSAAAEDTSNAYDDGQVVGSVIGHLDDTASTVARAWELDLPGGKVEGITCVSAATEPLVVWLVTDQDDEARPSQLLECTIPAE